MLVYYLLLETKFNKIWLSFAKLTVIIIIVIIIIDIILLLPVNKTNHRDKFTAAVKFSFSNLNHKATA